MAASSSLMAQGMQLKLAERAACEAAGECPTVRPAQALTPCVDGMAGEYPCKDVDMLSFVPLALMNSSGANDLWGWTDPATGRDYALVGLFHGVSFVDITEPSDPRVIGMMKTQSSPSVWRDLKVYDNHVFVVSEAKKHGMQVFDLTRLRGKVGHGVGGVQPGAIRNRYGFCLVEGLGGNTSENASSPEGSGAGGLALRACDASHSGHAEMDWVYNPTAGSVMSQASGLCLEVEGSLRLGGLLRTRNCNPGHEGQRWKYMESSGQLVGRGGGCLDAAEPRAPVGDIRLRRCDSSRSGQQWSVGADAPEVFSPDTVYREFSAAHNIAINEQTATAFVLGSETCKGGLHMVNISAPKDPEFLGCFDEDGYSHDAQCEIYEGPDANFRGRHICFNYNEDTLTLVDVSDVDKPKQVARVGYTNSRYVHQGWLDEKQEFLFLNDERDELGWKADRADGPSNHTRTLIWDVRNLSDPKLVGSYFSKETSIDHNLYVDGRLVFEANYCAGLRVMEAQQDEKAEAPRLEEIAYFDVEPACDAVRFRGAWSNYPFYKSGVVTVTSMQRGLFVLRPRLSADLQSSRLQAHGRRGERRAIGLAGRRR